MDSVKEGALYKLVKLGGRTIELRYGYYDAELERGNIELTPIYPNFYKDPLYTKDGIPFVTADQDICEWFNPKLEISSESWCNDCEYIEKHEEFIGLCKCPFRKKSNG